MPKNLTPEGAIRHIVARPHKATEDSSLGTAIRRIMNGRPMGQDADASLIELKPIELMRRIHARIKKRVDVTEAAEESLRTQAAQALNRFVMSDRASDRSILILIAAIVLLNNTDDEVSIATARKMIAASLLKNKGKKDAK